MRVEIGGHQTGKTTRMVEWLRAHEHAVLFVHNEAEAERLRNLYDPDGVMELANRIVTARSHLRRPGSFYRPRVAIDNTDLILCELFGDVRLVTFTEEVER